MRVALITPSDGHQAPVMVARHLRQGLLAEGVHARLFHLGQGHAAGAPEESTLTWRGLPALLTEFDIVHTHGLRPDLLVGFGRLGVAKAHARWVSTLHCDMRTDLVDLHGRMVGEVASALWRGALRLADGQIFLSESIAKHYASAACEVVPNGLPETTASTAVGDPQVLQTLQSLRAAHVLVGTLANTRPLKRIDLMLQAVAIAPDWHFVHFGDGPERAALQALAEQLNVSARCHFMGHLPEAVAYLPLMHAYLNASVTEASPLSVLEAFRAGTPVIAPRIPPFTSLLAERPQQLFTAGSAPDLVSAVQLALPNARDIGNWQRASFQSGFTARRMAERHLRFYASLLRSGAQTTARG